MRATRTPQYAWVHMASLESAWLADLAAPLVSKFGEGLTLCRDGRRVEWSYGGQSAVIELTPQGTLEAMFVERPVVDAVSSNLAAAVYRPRHVPYSLTPAGCTRMVDDLVDFFSGVREPYFVFSNAHTLHTAG
jgi:hypothetical protein